MNYYRRYVGDDGGGGGDVDKFIILPDCIVSKQILIQCLAKLRSQRKRHSASWIIKCVTKQNAKDQRVLYACA